MASEIKQGQIDIEQAQRIAALEFKADEVVAQVQSQIASAALAALNIGATLQDTYSGGA